MRNTESVEETMTVTNYNVVEIICNKCGDKDTKEEYDHERFQEFSLSFGYGSRYDSEHWSFDLCDQCLTDLIKTFKHVPEGFGEDSHFAKYPQTMFDYWKETEEINLEAGMTPEEIAAHGGSIYAEFDEDEKGGKSMRLIVNYGEFKFTRFDAAWSTLATEYGYEGTAWEMVVASVDFDVLARFLNDDGIDAEVE